MEQYTIEVLMKTRRNELVELNKLLVTNWYRPIDDEYVPSDWEELTSMERYNHGGPWNDPIFLDLHLNSFEQFGNVSIIRENKTNELVGEIEYHRVNGENIHIDWMMSSPNHRQKGIGRKLINYIIENENAISKIITEPEDDVDEFYRKIGFTPCSNKSYSYTTKGVYNSKSIEWVEGIHPELTKQSSKNIIIGGLPTYQYYLHIYKYQFEMAKLFNLKNYFQFSTIDFNGIEYIFQYRRSFNRPNDLYLAVHRVDPSSNGNLNEIINIIPTYFNENENINIEIMDTQSREFKLWSNYMTTDVLTKLL
ncbi:MAG: GNAT family N-acetyltransferase [Candidatus Heimdallarchaeota archaeon]|nr:GNAT family N-acetyltransferase [Candidatus Heimdallarchaeota archaeon]MDH5645669.1 GNAT family N-acetyltransferase [Candidatus Heimdallarchaeota archaeon]